LQLDEEHDSIRAMNTELADQVYELVAQIPKGKVTTYGDVARALGINSPRWVGRALHGNTDPIEVPCHRVVNAQGSLAAAYVFGGKDVQRQKLLDEGVLFHGDRVDLHQCRHTFLE
jgi:methylated-DNA-protein-cysteine methyltransferase-like protein